MLMRQTTAASPRRPQDLYEYDFHDVSHPEEVLDALRGFYSEGLFTDIALQCSSGQVLHCHKVALCARSSYFRVMFTADMRERTNSLVRLPVVEVEVLSALVDYIYSSSFTITQLNVESLLKAADLLQFGAVKMACEAFLVRLLDVDNCLGMLPFFQLHACLTLEKEARRLLAGRFQEVIKEEEFLELDPDSLRTVLAEENQEVVAEAVVRWLGHDPLIRTKQLSSLELHINPTNLSNALLKMRGYNELNDSDSLLSMSTITPMFKQSSMRSNRMRSSSRMITIGGYHWRPLSKVQRWDVLSGEWVQGEEMPDYTKESYAVALLGCTIYVSGGYRTNTTEVLDAVWEYNSDSDYWTEGQSMLTARYYHCSVACCGCVYVMGGYRGGSAMSQTEQFDPLKRRWMAVADMVQGVGNASATVLGNNIYVAGGNYGFKGSCSFNKIQSYKVDVDQWSILTTCPHPEYGMCLVSLNGSLYLVGGQTTLTERFDPDTEEWISLASMKERRIECGAVAMLGCVYVTGGYSCSKGTYLQSVEKYDPHTDAWDIVGDLTEAARLHGCISVYNGVDGQCQAKRYCIITLSWIAKCQ
ncbi:kelch-like protein 23 [Sebastes umbrosus]|uniref:kelch-like protein 23 n=1 Tax=Sebastes umbrosus TaxID=72105 RepID=UPI0018A04716|nr:kelch-like protein 23 [Sebastes umbrosus]